MNKKLERGDRSDFNDKHERQRSPWVANAGILELFACYFVIKNTSDIFRYVKIRRM